MLRYLLTFAGQFGEDGLESGQLRVQCGNGLAQSVLLVTCFVGGSLGLGTFGFGRMQGRRGFFQPCTGICGTGLLGFDFCGEVVDRACAGSDAILQSEQLIA
jgi:hypothetical protein